MPGPADHGVLIHALDLDTLARFYAQLLGLVWDDPGIRYRSACDPEGNIVQRREVVAIA